jgi:hypothetical protein
LNDVHTVSVGRAFLDLHCLTTYDAAQQIDEGAFVVAEIVLAVPHFFAFGRSTRSSRNSEGPLVTSRGYAVRHFLQLHQIG